MSDMMALAQKLFPLCRSLTGNGVRETLRILKTHLPSLELFEVPSHTPCFDWQVPLEWNIQEAYLVDPEGKKVVDFKELNLHVVGYSEPVDKKLSLQELTPHLYSLPDQPHAVPYITSYYEKRWGFCLSEEKRKTLKEGSYHAYINSELKEGHMSYGELKIPGEKEEEILLSTYLCHPSMAHNELSGPIVMTYLVQWLLEEKRKYSYRILFIPETIGSIYYLSRHLESLKKRVKAGFNLTCLGDEAPFSYLPSRKGKTLADQVAQHVLKHLEPGYKEYSFLDRGSDERQYCSPGMDLPLCLIMRSKFGSYKEYHTSLDNLDFITEKGLQESLALYRKCLVCLEENEYLKTQVLCEPFMGKRGLYPTLGTKEKSKEIKTLMNLLAYCDGETSLLEIAEILNEPLWELLPYVNCLKKEDLVCT